LERCWRDRIVAARIVIGELEMRPLFLAAAAALLMSTQMAAMVKADEMTVIRKDSEDGSTTVIKKHEPEDKTVIKKEHED
jgi:hypothetical protein